MRPVLVGLALGAINVLVIAIGLEIVSHDDAVGTLVVVIGGLPGVLLGGLLGIVANVTRRQARWARRFVLIVPALLLVVALAATFGFQDLILVASIPTVVAALILERSTREVVVPPVPVAQVRT